MATVAGDPIRSSSSITDSGDIEASCSGTSNARKASSASRVGTTARSFTASRKRCDRLATSASTCHGELSVRVGITKGRPQSSREQMTRMHASGEKLAWICQ
jgi:hypothetical protein